MLPAGMASASRLGWSDSGSANVPNLKTKPSILDAPALLRSLSAPINPTLSLPPDHFHFPSVVFRRSPDHPITRFPRFPLPSEMLIKILKHLRCVTPDQP